jgi:toxin ParE1/3/4
MGKIIWTKAAQKEVEEIYLYHFERSELYARRVIDTIFISVFRLETFPKLGKIVPEFNTETLRELSILGYRIVY